MLIRYSPLLAALVLALAGCGRSEPAPAEPKPGPAVPDAASMDNVPASTDATAATSSTGSNSKANEATDASASTNTADPPQPADIRSLAVRLVEPDSAGGWRISEQAALELEKRGPNAAKQLWPLLEDKSADVRRGAAFYLLGQFNPNLPEQVDAFLRRLQDEDALVRGIALQAVGQMREPDLISSQALLAEVLDPDREPDSDQRIAVVRVLQRMKGAAAESAPALAKAAETDPDPKVRAAALVALSQIAPPAEVVAAVQQALDDDDAGVRLVAAARLRQLGKEALPAVDVLAESLQDADQRVRSAAAEALARLGADAVPALIKQLEARPATARQLAVACLSRIGPPASQALPALRERLNDEDETVRKLAAVAISKIDAGKAPPPAAADSPSPP